MLSDIMSVCHLAVSLCDSDGIYRVLMDHDCPDLVLVDLLSPVKAFFCRQDHYKMCCVGSGLGSIVE